MSNLGLGMDRSRAGNRTKAALSRTLCPVNAMVPLPFTGWCKSTTVCFIVQQCFFFFNFSVNPFNSNDLKEMSWMETEAQNFHFTRKLVKKVKLAQNMNIYHQLWDNSGSTGRSKVRRYKSSEKSSDSTSQANSSFKKMGIKYNNWAGATWEGIFAQPLWKHVFGFGSNPLSILIWLFFNFKFLHVHMLVKWELKKVPLH